MKRVVADVAIMPSISGLEIKKQYIMRQMFEMNALQHELI
jgi:hypothetical protein